MALKLKASTIQANYPTPYTGSHENILLIPSTSTITVTKNSFIQGITTAQNDASTPQYRLLWVHNEGPENLGNVTLFISGQNNAGATTTMHYFDDKGEVTTNTQTTITASFPGNIGEWSGSVTIGNLPAGYAAGVWTKTIGNKDIAVSEDFITLQTTSDII